MVRGRPIPTECPKQEKAMPSYLIIWENNTFGHQKVKGHAWPGHAAMNIGDRFAREKVNAEENSYVSWWPMDNASFGAKELFKDLFKKGGEMGRPHYTFIHDVDA